MKKYFLIISVLLLHTILGYSQTGINIKGPIKNTSGKALSNATVQIWQRGSADTLKRLSNEEGFYIFNNIPFEKFT